MTYIDGSTIYLDEFDESLDAIMIDLVNLIKRKIVKAAANPDPEDAPSIEFWINSMGGDSHKAFALVELMEWAKGAGVHVNTVVLSEAASSGSIVACAGSKGLRRTTRNALWLMHYGDVDIQATSPVDLRRQATTYLTHFNHVRQHYINNSKHNAEFWEGRLATDNYTITGVDAVGLGLADGYLGE